MERSWDTISDSEITNSAATGDFIVGKGGLQIPNTDGALGRDSFFIASSGSTNAYLTDVVDINGESAVVRLPSGVSANGFYFMWPGNADGIGNPVPVNKPEGWHVLPQYVGRGGDFSFYGRNLVADRTNPTSWIYCVEADEWIEADSANPYKADYTVPSNWPNGTYTIYAHNGTGGGYAWSQPLTIYVDQEQDWSLGTTHYIEDYGGVGDNSTDNMDAITNAFANMSAGDTLQFSNGTYLVRSVLPYLEDIRIIGSGMDSTIIADHPNWSRLDPAYGFTHSNDKFVHVAINTEIADLTFHSGTNKPESIFIVCPPSVGCDRMVLNGVRFDASDSLDEKGNETSIDITAVNNVSMRDCEIISGRNVFMAGTNMLIESCDFIGMT